ncbi:hypothetical protein T01_3406 [Trichinella spiralis]|uniref:Uncharacterized protein n=1 Tax=Trichinella spiralis TaxID=6334 RepID=A0A0V1BDD9_TRISP|nr:hypothetical protein T01_3406 [Trichinella spiralis]
MLQTNMYHINTAITGTCIRQAFTILYRLKFICMLKASYEGGESRGNGSVTELVAEMEIRGAECGKESFWKNKCKVEKPWKRNAFVAAAGKLYLLIRFTFLLG